ncbi:uncharacterized protein BCR38DRAFT_173026 [Pseudomassariella vexata]|uniref:Uncharacterized protein n=1 Tax=Pseudomassariella vexata TaxID=1141098 RepID=A0A1Y2E3U5_9PEZI|nr:uncharacterized protein BCR38DRAFT_173026 [Pseudomassariella vexata]ORY66117.1 hypothetical protein BCR38DRAFT_173026 [Pseudomassariella vexata]
MGSYCAMQPTTGTVYFELDASGLSWVPFSSTSRPASSFTHITASGLPPSIKSHKPVLPPQPVNQLSACCHCLCLGLYLHPPRARHLPTPAHALWFASLVLFSSSLCTSWSLVSVLVLLLLSLPQDPMWVPCFHTSMGMQADFQALPAFSPSLSSSPLLRCLLLSSPSLRFLAFLLPPPPHTEARHTTVTLSCFLSKRS